MYFIWRNKYLGQPNCVYVVQLTFIWVIENLIIITEDSFDDIQPLINLRITAYVEISSVIHRYDRLNYISSDCFTDNYRYIIQTIFKYRNIALTDTFAFTELGD